MHRTCESRWFLDPQHPTVVRLEGLFAGVAPDRAGERDAYLWTGRDDLGVKVRARGGHDARLEIKVRQGVLGPIAVGEHVATTVELWSKAVSTKGSDLEGEAAWVEIEKERRVRRWAVRGDRLEERSPGDGDVAAQVELCRVTRGTAAAVTFGVETHGRDADLVGAHLAVLRLVVGLAGGVELGASDAMGYPAWILREGGR